MKFLMVDVHSNGWITIYDDNGNRMSYLYYSKREAISKFRQQFNLVGKHMVKIEVEQ